MLTPGQSRAPIAALSRWPIPYPLTAAADQPDVSLAGTALGYLSGSGLRRVGADLTWPDACRGAGRVLQGRHRIGLPQSLEGRELGGRSVFHGCHGAFL